MLQYHDCLHVKAPGTCRLISSKDDFQSTFIPSIVIYEEHPDVATLRAYPDFLTVSSSGSVTISNESYATLDEATAREIASCWGNYLKLLKSRDVDNHRIENALGYFFYASRLLLRSKKGEWGAMGDMQDIK